MGTSSSSGPEPPGAGPAERFRTRRSPLADLADSSGVLSAPQPWGLAIVHTLDPPTADAALPLGPGRWLAVHETPPDGATTVPELHGGPAIAVDVSHGMTRLRLSGSSARQVLAAGIAIDLHPDAFPPSASAATAYRDVFVVLHATAEETFDVYVLRSFAASLWTWLADAAQGVA
jgi:heterotetrameric sarcosine oxidase gamma subunit